MQQDQASEFFRVYDLVACRQLVSDIAPAAHQQVALDKLRRWYESPRKSEAGGMLVLPTGGGKTFTASHFLCRHPLSDGHRVLWLAHTHHLLEQAFVGLNERLVKLVAEPRSDLRVRLVSGTIGHFKVADIKPSDDMVVATIQTIWNAAKNLHPAVEGFIAEDGRPLFLVIDEAHHTPAPSYRKLIEHLRKRTDNLMLLGLTATPTYGDPGKKGWLAKLFPQGILHQIRADELMAAGVLARPRIENVATNVEAAFDPREFEKWLHTNQDIPEYVIGKLAENQQRNTLIVETYVQHRERFGKTLIFADRWFQCDYMREALRKRGVRADVVYSHVEGDPGSSEARKRRVADANTKIIEAFRKNALDVLINVRMLTEGTDVPNVQTVFLTRQTTSQILLTQMVGRALRGPKFGGTEEANIVSFIDNWEQGINWAEYGQLSAEGTDGTESEYGKRPPLQLISIDLIRALARQMDSGVNVAPAPFQLMLPIGWYRADYHVLVEGTEEQEPKTRLVMIFEHEREAFDQYLQALKKVDLEAFGSEGSTLSGEALEQISGLAERFFISTDRHVGGDLLVDLFDLARHVAQNNKLTPQFFPFEDRTRHDLDKLAQGVIDGNLNLVEIQRSVQTEYARHDLFWRVIYPTYDMFKCQFDACVNRLLRGAAPEVAGSGPGNGAAYTTPERVKHREPSDDLKRDVIARDGEICLCCGYDITRRTLEVDHVAPFYLGGDSSPQNLQTLCRQCNQDKGVRDFNFRKKSTTLAQPPEAMPMFDPPEKKHLKERRRWEFNLRRTINCFYQCAAVNKVTIGQRGEQRGIWRVYLNPGNPPEWLYPYLMELNRRIRQAGGLGESLVQVVVGDGVMGKKK